MSLRCGCQAGWPSGSRAAGMLPAGDEPACGTMAVHRPVFAGGKKPHGCSSVPKCYRSATKQCLVTQRGMPAPGDRERVPPALHPSPQRGKGDRSQGMLQG